MGSDVRHVCGEAQNELVKKFEVLTSKGRSRWQVWSDWITISAIAVSNATDKSHFDEREQQYMTIVKKYTKQEVDAFADMFSILVMALEDNSEQDFLGELYMCLGLGSDHAGQFQKTGYPPHKAMPDQNGYPVISPGGSASASSARRSIPASTNNFPP